MSKKRLLVIALVCLVVAVPLAYAASVRAGNDPVQAIRDVQIAAVTDIDGSTYPLKFDLFEPKNHNNDPRPLLLFIHGNGRTYNFPNGSRSYALTIDLAKQGVAVASID